jgi:DNA-binding NtrC family response regulator
MISAGAFREDLYYRLNVIEIAVPALANRPEDIAVLAEHFLGSKAKFTEEAINALQSHSWPGNVRELRNAIERAALLSRHGLIRADDLNLPPPLHATRDLDEPDRVTIEAALQCAGGVVSRAAQALGLSRQALYRRMDRLGLRG